MDGSIKQEADMATDARVTRYWESALAGARWLLAQQKADGSFSSIEEGVDAYYKIPYALSVTGHPRQAHQLLDWTLREGALTPDGDLRGKTVKAQDRWHSQCYSYSNSWMVIGAQRLGRFDYARPAMAFIRGLLSAANGGVFSEPAFAVAGSGRQDIVVSSQAGSACLYMGLWDEATRIGDWFIEMLRLQPDPERILYTCCDPQTGLITEYPAEEAILYAVDTAKPLQWYFYPGIAMGFLTKLYLATGRQAYLDASASYFTFFTRCHADAYNYGPSVKVGWGSSIMYSITGDEKYRQAASAIGDAILGAQRDDGHWDPSVGNPITRYILMDATAECTAWMAEIAQHLRD
jgi:hypothetical protein